jgi:hypothetical protein
MKRQLLLFLISLSLCLALANCRHDRDEKPTPIIPCQYDSSVEEMKKWYFFKEGTWWIYQEQNSGTLDTITVYYDWEGTNIDGTIGFETWGNSSHDGFNYKYSFNSSFSIRCITADACLCHKIKRVKTMPGNYAGEGQIFLFPIIEGNYSYLISSDGNEYGRTISTSLLSTYYLNEQEFEQVVEWHVDIDGSMDDAPAIYKVAKYTGIIEYEYPESNQHWVLIEKNIIH